MWLFDGLEDRFQEIGLNDEPALAAFAENLQFRPTGWLDVNASILKPYEMIALPLVEWDVSPDATTLFNLLAEAGSTKGFFVDSPSIPKPEFWQAILDRTTASIIDRDELFAWDRFFVDDQFQLAIAAEYSDFTYLCMRPALFDRWLSRHPIALDLTDGFRPPRFNNFRDALREAFRRLDDWHAMSGNAMPWVRDQLSWQLNAR